MSAMALATVDALDFPRIERRDAGTVEVRDIAGDDRQAMNQRGRGDQGIAFRAWIGNVKMRATPRHFCIDGEDATLEAGQDLIVYPRTKNGALRRVPARDLERAELKFEDRNGREKKAREGNPASPRDDIRIRPLRPSQFGNDIGVEKEHQSVFERRSKGSSRGRSA